MPEPGPPRIPTNRGKLTGIIRKPIKQRLIFRNKAPGDIRPLLIIPIQRGGKLCLGRSCQSNPYQR